MQNPILLACAIFCATLTFLMPFGFNVVFAWLAYMYWKMSKA